MEKAFVERVFTTEHSKIKINTFGISSNSRFLIPTSSGVKINQKSSFSRSSNINSGISHESAWIEVFFHGSLITKDERFWDESEHTKCSILRFWCFYDVGIRLIFQSLRFPIWKLLENRQNRASYLRD